MTTKPTRIAGRYDLGDIVGRGGIGTVYRAIQHPLERPVALKMLRPEFSELPTLRRRFVREARTVAALAHPNIATVHDFGVDDDDHLFLVLELVDGESLESLGQRGALDLPTIARVFNQMLTGLGHAHARGVIHRDIKPANILVTRDEAGLPWVKIVDFGIAALTGVTGFDEDRGSGTGQIVGTPQYMAPEQVRGERHVSATVDVYAVALTLFWAITGEHAFDGATPIDVLSKQLNQPPPPLAPQPGLAIPPGLEPLMHRALSKSPAERVPSALAFREALAQLIGTGEDAKVTGVGTLSAGTERRTVVELTGVELPDVAEPAPLEDSALGQAPTLAAPRAMAAPAASPAEIPMVREAERGRLLDHVTHALASERGTILTIEGSPDREEPHGRPVAQRPQSAPARVIRGAPTGQRLPSVASATRSMTSCTCVARARAVWPSTSRPSRHAAGSTTRETCRRSSSSCARRPVRRVRASVRRRRSIGSSSACSLTRPPSSRWCSSSTTRTSGARTRGSSSSSSPWSSSSTLSGS